MLVNLASATADSHHQSIINQQPTAHPPLLPPGWSSHAISHPPPPVTSFESSVSTTSASSATSVSTSTAMVLSSRALMATGAPATSTSTSLVATRGRGALLAATGRRHLSTDSADAYEHSRRANELLQLMRSRASRRWLRGWLRQEGRVDRLLDLLETAHPTIRQALIDVLSRLLGEDDLDDEDALADHYSIVGGSNPMVVHPHPNHSGRAPGAPSHRGRRRGSEGRAVPVLNLGRLPLLQPIDEGRIVELEEPRFESSSPRPTVSRRLPSPSPSPA